MKKKKNLLAFIFLIIGFLAFLIWLFTIVYNFGLKVRNINKYLEYIYYIGSLLLIMYFIIYPFFSILFAPPYTYHFINKELTGTHKKKVIYNYYLKQVKFAKKLLKRGRISLDNRKLLKEKLKSKDDLVTKCKNLHEVLVLILKKDIQKDIRQIIISSARDTLYLSSLSQNNLVDVLIVIVNNFRMLKKIVVRCGFRPSFFRLLKFYINVAFSSLIADGAEKLDIQSMLGSTINSIAKPVVGSLIDGTINAFFMLRTGFLAKDYIFSEYNNENEKDEIQNSAFLEATTALPELTIASIFSPLNNLFQKGIINPTKTAVNKLFSKRKDLKIEENILENDDNTLTNK